MLTKLENQHLIEIYYKSIKLNLDYDFIWLLQQEISKRGLSSDITPAKKIHLEHHLKVY